MNLGANLENRVHSWNATKTLYHRHLIFPNDLLMTPLKIVPDAICKEEYRGLYYAEQMVCALGNGKDACEGDSGSPLACSLKESEKGKTSRDDSPFKGRVLVGLVSFGSPCLQGA
ncbi:unnamed protein product, partial [Cyprideis torosa]